MHIRPEKAARVTSAHIERVKPRQARKRLDSLFPSHHPVLPLFISASLHLRECLFVFLFSLFSNPAFSSERSRTSKTSTFCVCPLEKSFTPTCSRQPPAPQRDPYPPFNRGGGPPTLPMRNPHSTREPKSPEFLSN